LSIDLDQWGGVSRADHDSFRGRLTRIIRSCSKNEKHCLIGALIGQRASGSQRFDHFAEQRLHAFGGLLQPRIVDGNVAGRRLAWRFPGA
jgi:hypothetical protein